MSMSQTIKEYLRINQTGFALSSHADSRSLEQAARAGEVDPGHVVRGVLLEDEQGVLLAVLPLSHLIDFKALEVNTGRRLTPATEASRQRHFPDCDAGSTPPFGAAYRVPMILDEHLQGVDPVFLEAGRRSGLISLGNKGFGQLMQGTPTAVFGQPLGSLEAILQRPEAALLLRGLTPRDAAKQRIESLYSLPPLPDMARRILHLRNNPDVTVEELSAVVALDPSLSAQVIRYASSPLFGYRGSIESIHDAVARVLGLEVVMNMLLGLVIGRSLRHPPDGPLGLDAFWRHAIYAAAICQALARHLPADKRVKPGVAYLAGLLHNFGILLLGHLFPAEFFLLNKLATANPQTPLSRLEAQVFELGGSDSIFNMGHAEIGAWLMQAWNMPEELIVAVREHHQPTLEGEYSRFAKLVHIANILLHPHGMGDAVSDVLPEKMLEDLGLSEAAVRAVAAQVMENSEALDGVTRLLAA